MSFGPTFLDLLDGVVSEGRGVAASVLGQTYDVRRLDPTATGLFTQVPVLTDFQGYTRRTTTRTFLENGSFEVLTYIATCDDRLLMKGDLLSETGYGDSGSSYIYVQKEPMGKTIWVRTESRCSLRRNLVGINAIAQPNPVPKVQNLGYGGRTFATDAWATYGADTYSFSQTASTLEIPCGVQQQNRSRGQQTPNVPSSMEQSRFCIYLPPLPGITIEPNDEIAVTYFAEKRTYLVRQCLETSVGFVGTIAFCEMVDA